MVENKNDLKMGPQTISVLMAIDKILHGLKGTNLYKILQISSVPAFEKAPISQVFPKLYSQNSDLAPRNCLSTLDF